MVEVGRSQPGLLFELRRPFEAEGPNRCFQLFSGAANSITAEADAGAAAAGPDGLIDTTTIDAPSAYCVRIPKLMCSCAEVLPRSSQSTMLNLRGPGEVPAGDY